MAAGAMRPAGGSAFSGAGGLSFPPPPAAGGMMPAGKMMGSPPAAGGIGGAMKNIPPPAAGGMMPAGISSMSTSGSSASISRPNFGMMMGGPPAAGGIGGAMKKRATKNKDESSRRKSSAIVDVSSRLDQLMSYTRTNGLWNAKSNYHSS